MIFRIPIDRINWTTSSFLIGTFFLTLTAVPLYLWYFGVDWFHVALFAVLLAATGFSITLGYHRLFSHMTFRAKLPVRLFILIFGAAAFENSVLMWASEHRRHHKHVDHDEDPYDITKGFFHAHIGWLLFKLLPQPPFDNVNDLKKDPLVMFIFWRFLSASACQHWPGSCGMAGSARLAVFSLAASQKLWCSSMAHF